uniref:Uncharacterized protein n=1 Tax=Corethron hystrix TaxID=216773 RepID=A0A7S1BWR7_9STRA|mmetsp:Transcript_41782/g.97839  ORF Transcript_41782/g.97839 Transcript_41782/m.97839 type:complete len:332 (+) Transcript_41782:170-1165(+)
MLGTFFKIFFSTWKCHNCCICPVMNVLCPTSSTSDDDDDRAYQTQMRSDARPQRRNRTERGIAAAMRPPSLSKILGSFAFMTATLNVRAQTPLVRLHSLNSAAARHLRVIHVVRHAEGHHNVNRDYRNPLNYDAELTERGIEQCAVLSRRLRDTNFAAELVVSSPTRRALQTARRSFAHLWDGEGGEGEEKIPFVAYESWRETLNFVCDARLPLARLREDFPEADFGGVRHEEDPLSEHYVNRFGPFEDYAEERESRDDEALERRVRRAWADVATRPERSVAVVSHSAFFWHMFARPELGVVVYGDDDAEALMAGRGFDNCEMRSVAFEIL